MRCDTCEVNKGPLPNHILVRNDISMKVYVTIFVMYVEKYTALQKFGITWSTSSNQANQYPI